MGYLKKHLVPIAGLMLLCSSASLAGTAKQISQYGITWTFDKEYEIGQFVNGDYWVAGPCSIVSVSPAPVHGENGRNGSMINPEVKTRSKQGYDSRSKSYDLNLMVRFPRVLQPDQSLISTISLADAERRKTIDLVGGKPSAAILRTAAVLTCLPKPADSTMFRPPYAGTRKPLFDSDDLKRELLPALVPAEGKFCTNRGAKGKTPCQQFARYFQRPWLLHVWDYLGRSVHPVENMPGYHKSVHAVITDASLLLVCNYPDREGLLINFVQLGIDSYHVTIAGNGKDDGDSSLHKWPVVLAGLLLSYEPMQNTQYELYRTDEKTYYAGTGKSRSTSKKVPAGQGWTGAKALWRHGIGSQEHEHLHPTEWLSSGDNSKKYGGFKREGYRRLNTEPWPGLALAVRLTDAVDTWNHQAFFDYVDRWMTEQDADNFKYIETLGEKLIGQKLNLWIPGGKCSSEFSKNMWDTYRNPVEKGTSKGAAKDDSATKDNGAAEE